MIFNRGLVCRHFFQVMIRSQQAKFCISLIKKRWFKLEITNNYNDFNSQEQTFIDINRQPSSMHSLTILSTLREDLKDTSIDVDMKIEARHLYGNLFGLGRKIAQIATEKRRFDTLEILNQILEELYDDTNEIINESNKILNPHIVKSKGRPRNNRFKSSVETHKDSNKNGNSIQDNDEQGSSQNNNSRSKTCSNCNATSHNIRRCTAPCKSCKKDGHTYVNCKGKNVEK